MNIEYVKPDGDKPHALRVGLRTTRMVPQRDENGNKVLDANGNLVMIEKPVVYEVTVRKARFESLTAAKKITYARECADYHTPEINGADGRAKREARRAAWDADDQAKAEAAALAARQAEEAKFVVTPQGFVRNKAGDITHVQVTIQHHGLTWSGQVAYSADKTTFEQACRDAFGAYEAAVNEEKAALAALAISQ